MSSDLIAALEEARSAEKAQALFYRALAALAEERGDAALSERFNELHADEQHHLSRLTARVMELGGAPADLAPAPEAVALEGWEARARTREQAEVLRYQRMLRANPDPHTVRLLASILDAETHHAEELGGKWTAA